MKRLKDMARQRGVALMMTLGILALLLIMAMSFAYTARTERLAAGVNTDLIRARLLAESGLERAIAFMREQYANVPAPALDPTAAKRFYVPVACPQTDDAWVFDPATSRYGRGGRYLAGLSRITGSVDGTQHLVKEALASTVPISRTGASYFLTSSAALYDNTAAPGGSAVGWIPVMVDHGSGTESCIGLEAYLVIDETGKLDPSEAAGGAYGISPVPTEDTSTPDTRLGLYPGEIALADVLDESVPAFSYGSIYGNALQNRLVGATRRWDSMFQILNRFDANLGPSPLDRRTVSQPWLNRFIWSLRPFSVAVPETYQETDAGPTYHRCDLTALNWDAMTGIASLPVTRLPATDPYDATAGIPWLDRLDANVRNQVKANMIDFCDTDHDATTDYDAATCAATYCGLEKVPYINEVQICFSYAHDVAADTNGDGAADGQGSLDAAVSIEFVNMYDDGVSDIGVEWQITCRAVEVSPGTATHDLSSVSSAPVPFTVGANSYAVMGATTAGAAALKTSIPLTGTTMPQPVTLTVSSIKIVLTRSGQCVDYAWVLGSDNASPAALSPGSALLSPNYKYYGRAVNDPRCNTRLADWVLTDNFTDASTQISLGAKNSAVIDVTTLPADHGLTAAVDPATASSASPVNKYIADRAPVTFWELGAIHRGAPWQTINLHSSDQASASVGQYSYGDWPLLNQVKLTAAVATRGLFNVWDIPTYVWKPLLQGIKVGCDYGDPADYSLPATATELSNNAALVAACPVIAGSAPTWNSADYTYRGRGAIVGYTKLSDGTLATQDTDAKQEEIIGKVVGLLDGRISYYTVIVTALAVDDIGLLPDGMSTPPGEWIRYDLGGDGTVDSPLDGATRDDRYCRPMAEQKVMALVWRDVVGNRFRVASFQYLDEE